MRPTITITLEPLDSDCWRVSVNRKLTGLAIRSTCLGFVLAPLATPNLVHREVFQNAHAAARAAGRIIVRAERPS